MAARSESWSPPAEGGRAALVAALALALFVGSWAALHEGFYTHAQIIDTPVYQKYGDAIARGKVPYRDFGVEYPPGALPVFALPAVVQDRPEDLAHYRRVFEALMWACGALGLLAMALALRGLGAGTSRTAAVLGFAALAPLAPGGVWESVVRQTTRPLQIESLSSGALLAVHHVFGLTVHWKSSHGSQNLVGTAPDVLGALQTVLQVSALLAVWTLFARGRGGRDELVRASAAAVCAFVALGKVLSPQYLIWLVLLVPLVRGRRGAQATVLLGASLVLTQLWFPYRYWRLVFSFDGVASWLVLARDLVLLALLATLIRPERERI